MEHRVVRGRVIHVNEDGWVIINRGAQDGIGEGQKFVVLGEHNPRQIHNLYPEDEGAGRSQPPVLRVDTAYELLRVILVERQCCVAISDRVPLERTPQPFLGPQGELLLYTPPPPDWRYDALDLESSPAEDDTETDASEDDEPDEPDANDADQQSSGDEQVAATAQQDRLWDGALPLNALQVGDEVVLAQPYQPGVWAASLASVVAQPGAAPAPADSSSALTSEPYDWFKEQ
jgi:hypothetical protein